MILATTQVEDFDRFLQVFSTKGAEKRKQHGSNGSPSFAIPPRTIGSGCCSIGMRRAGRASSPTRRSRRSCKEAGHQGRPQVAQLGGQYAA